MSDQSKLSSYIGAQIAKRGILGLIWTQVGQRQAIDI